MLEHKLHLICWNTSFVVLAEHPECVLPNHSFQHSSDLSVFLFCIEKKGERSKNRGENTLKCVSVSISLVFSLMTKQKSWRRKKLKKILKEKPVFCWKPWSRVWRSRRQSCLSYLEPAKGKVHRKIEKKLVKISFRYIRVAENFENLVFSLFFPNILWIDKYLSQ